MLKKRYQILIKNALKRYLPAKTEIFVFGSSLRSDNFKDIDVGIDGSKVSSGMLLKLRDELEASILPYAVDVVDFSRVDKNFRKCVFEDKVLWLT